MTGHGFTVSTGGRRVGAIVEIWRRMPVRCARLLQDPVPQMVLLDYTTGGNRNRPRSGLLDADAARIAANRAHVLQRHQPGDPAAGPAGYIGLSPGGGETRCTDRAGAADHSGMHPPAPRCRRMHAGCEHGTPPVKKRIDVDTSTMNISITFSANMERFVCFSSRSIRNLSFHALFSPNHSRYDVLGTEEMY